MKKTLSKKYIVFGLISVTIQILLGFEFVRLFKGHSDSIGPLLIIGAVSSLIVIMLKEYKYLYYTAGLTLIPWIQMLIILIKELGEPGHIDPFALFIFLLPLITVIFVFLMPIKAVDVPVNLNPDLSTLTKKCPQCAEEIKLEAKICRFCNKIFTEEEVLLSIKEVKEKLKNKQ